MHGLRRSILFVLFVLFLSVLGITSSASAETDAPTIGCNSSGCSLWLFAYAWPDVVEVNALEFVRFKIDVNRTNVDLSGAVNYFGLLCMIPRISGLPICPR